MDSNNSISPERFTTAVVEALAEAEGVEPTKTDFNLYDHIDPDAVHNLYEHDSGEWELRYDVNGHEVYMDSGGVIMVDGNEYAFE